MHRSLVFLVLSAALTAGSGCAYFRHNPELVGQEHDQLVTNDLPVPEGFRMDKSSSWRHERSSFRRYQLTYRRADYLSEARVREFMLTNLPKAGWKVEFLHGLKETRILFVKDAEECEVAVREDFGDRFTELQIVVRPRETRDGALVARQGWSEPESSESVSGASSAQGTNSVEDGALK